jgi:hypothetical protein
MNKSEKIDQLALALHKVQAEVKNPAFDSTNPHFKSKFASLASVREAVLPILNKHGLSLSQFPKAGDGTAGCVNLLVHHSGQWLEEDCLLPLDKNNAQGAGSAITYARRYSLQGIAGVVAEEDDDANAASAHTEAPGGAITPTSGARGRVSPARRKVVEDTAVLVSDALKEDRDFDAYGYCESFTDQDEKVYLWTFLDSKQRSRLKAQAEVANRKAA